MHLTSQSPMALWIPRLSPARMEVASLWCVNQVLLQQTRPGPCSVHNQAPGWTNQDVIVCISNPPHHHMSGYALFTSPLLIFKGAIIFYREGGPSVCGEDQNFWGWSKGGTSFFSVGQRGGDRIFWGSKRGGTKKFFSNFVLRLWHNSFLNTLLKKKISRLQRNPSLYTIPHAIKHIHIKSDFSGPSTL